MSKYTVKEATKDYIKDCDFRIEAGDLANEMGKIYSIRLHETIDEHRQYNLDRIYILIETKRHSSNWNEVYLNMTVFPESKKLNKLYESMDYYEYDYTTDKLMLLWSVPEVITMKTFLRASDKYDPKFIYWINQYLKQEKINLKVSKPTIIK